MLRATLVLLIFLLAVILLAPLQLLALALKWPLRRTLPHIFHRLTAKLLGLRIRILGQRSTRQPLLILANHASWLDIVAISAAMPVVFVAKQEIRHWPFFGWLARMQRTIFIDRERRHKTGVATQLIAEHLIGGDAVVLFAEGTSSDGNHVLPFRPALIGAVHHVLARHAHVDRVAVQPLSICYAGFNGLAAGRQFRPRLAWYGEMDLLPHLLGIAGAGACDIVLTLGETATYDMQANRKDIARDAETEVRQMTALAARKRPDAA